VSRPTVTQSEEKKHGRKNINLYVEAELRRITLKMEAAYSSKIFAYTSSYMGVTT
jgi:hypothetical protein